MRPPTRRFTFTLIELQTVVAIITITGAMLLSTPVHGGESGGKDAQSVQEMGESVAVNCADDSEVNDSEAETKTMPGPLPFAHAHNDYDQKRPLLDALDHGFGSIEADIFLVDGQLLVAHHPKEFKPERTLEALYLDPLNGVTH